MWAFAFHVACQSSAEGSPQSSLKNGLPLQQSKEVLPTQRPPTSKRHKTFSTEILAVTSWHKREKVAANYRHSSAVVSESPSQMKSIFS